jgi:hypothetical protein
MLISPAGRLATAAVLLIAFAAAVLPVAANPALLDGRVFIVDSGIVSKDSKETGDTVTGDTITFVDGKFQSSAYDQYGYGKSKYLAVDEGSAIAFEVDSRNDKGGKMLWKGRVSGELIEGKVQYVRPVISGEAAEPAIEHWFKGKLKL